LDITPIAMDTRAGYIHTYTLVQSVIVVM
jgi:hypothetical protein